MRIAEIDLPINTFKTPNDVGAYVFDDANSSEISPQILHLIIGILQQVPREN